MKTLPLAMLVTLTAYAGFASLVIAEQRTPLAAVVGTVAVPVVTIAHLVR